MILQVCPTDTYCLTWDAHLSMLTWPYAWAWFNIVRRCLVHVLNKSTPSCHLKAFMMLKPLCMRAIRVSCCLPFVGVHGRPRITRSRRLPCGGSSIVIGTRTVPFKVRRQVEADVLTFTWNVVYFSSLFTKNCHTFLSWQRGDSAMWIFCRGHPYRPRKTPIGPWTHRLPRMPFYNGVALAIAFGLPME